MTSGARRTAFVVTCALAVSAIVAIVLLAQRDDAERTGAPRTISRGISLVISVVLPEPLQPARPIMRMEPLVGAFIIVTAAL